MSQLPPTDDDSLAGLVGRIADEFVEKLERGEHPQIEDYVRGHPPTIAEALRCALTDVLLIRQPDLAPSTEPPPVLGDFKIKRQVGRGGMGVVYEAEQLSLGRRVALKVLPAVVTRGSQGLRFIYEARLAARLHHTNIVPVFASGVDSGFYFYAMQFIDGPTLAQVVRELRRFRRVDTAAVTADSTPPTTPAEHEPAPDLEVDGALNETPTPWVSTLTTNHASHRGEYYRTVARLGIEAAEGLAHAHEFHIVHRDMKPGNMMVDERGHVWITDFGLAHHKGQAELTKTGDIIGTPAYMSPEQASGQRGVLDHRTDIYSLGATLYELLALKPPFGGSTPEILRQIERDEPLTPRRADRAIPVELETIVLKAMEKDPEDRFATARELADDLRRFLENKPIRAKPPTLLQRAKKWARRHRTPLRVAGALTLLSLIGFTALLAWSNWKLEGEKQKVLTALSDKQQALDEKQQALDDNLLLTARFAIERGAWREGVGFIEKAQATGRFNNSIPLRLDKIRALIALNDMVRARAEIESLLGLPDLGEHRGAVLLLYGDVLMGRDDAESERLLKQALVERLAPADEAYARALLAETTPEAVDRLRSALKLNPNLPRARACLELLLLLQARLDEAREELAKHETIFPEDRNAKVLRALLLALERDLDGARAVLKELSGQAEGAEIAVYQVLVKVLSEFRNPANPIDRETGLPNLSRLLVEFAPVLPRLWQLPAGKDNQAVIDAFGSVAKNFPMPLVLRKGLLALPSAVGAFGQFGTSVPGNARIIDDLTRVVSVHPEGTLMYLHALYLFAANRFPEARTAAQRAAATPALLPIRRQALTIASIAGAMIFLTNKDPVLRLQLAGDLRQILATPPPSEPYKPELIITLAWGINEVGLARQLVAEWEKQSPDNREALFYHAETELRAGAYGPALALAESALEKKPDDKRMLDLKKRAADKILEQAQRLQAPPAVNPAP
jgi:serine/threonine protein kinase